MKKKTLLRILKLIEKYKIMLILSILSALVSVTCTLSAPLVIGFAIDRMAAKGSVSFSSLFNTLLILAAIYLGSCIFQWLLNRLTNSISYQTVNGLREKMFSKLGTLPLRFYDKNPHGDTISRFINDVDAVSDGLLQGLMALISGVLTIIGTIIFMTAINPMMALVVLLSTPAVYYVAKFITKRSQSLFKQQARCLGVLNGYAEEMIEGQKTVQAFNFEKSSIEKFKETNFELYKVGVKSQFISAISNPSTRVVNNITYAFVGVLGAVAAISGKITVGNISSFLIYATLFAKPINEITNVLSQIQTAVASGERVFEILDSAQESPDEKDAIVLQDCKGAVSFKNVSFSYEKDRPLIENLNLEIAPGSKIAIVGHTGAGKTTLVNLLMRFYDVDGGSILIDGVDIRKYTRDSLRRNFGMVLQDTWLLESSISENIAYAKPDVTIEEIKSAAKAAGADGFIRKLPNGYDTVIDADGGSLSQGEKQILTIARVMLVNPPMLILDEATSSIDTYTEQRIDDTFMKMTQGRTSFVIAHRLSTVKDADVILVMDGGNIVESGSHSELLKKGGYYSKLYYSQFD